jgi:hypothetical protein
MKLNRLDMSMMREMEDRDFYHMYYVFKREGKYKDREDGIRQILGLVDGSDENAVSPVNTYLSAYSRYKLLMQ